MSESNENTNSQFKHDSQNLNDSGLLEAIGRAYFGNSWKKSMALALSVDERRITHWLQSTRPIPMGVWADLVLIGKERQQDIKSVETLMLGKMKFLKKNDL